MVKPSTKSGTEKKELVTSQSPPKQSSRYATIDFLRGFAIWIMVVLHVLVECYDDTAVTTSMEDVPISLLVILIIAVYLGGWCGFFLLLSSIGNMLSMHKSLLKGKTVGNLVTKQVIGGFFLLIFAYLSEAVIGYHGYVAGILEQNDISPVSMLVSGFTMETIHAVAWCVIINGIIQGILSLKGGYLKTKRNIIIYGILTITVFAITPLIWDFTQFILPNYPYGVGGQRPIIGETKFMGWVLRFFLLPLAGHPEPLFPFLSVSFLGSMIGIWLSREKPSFKGLQLGIVASSIMLIAGLIGAGVMVITGKQDAFSLLRDGWNLTTLAAWFWYMLILTGCQLLSLFIILRLVEFRGKSHKLAEKTKHFRRFGFVAFSVYNFQYIYLLPRYIIYWINNDIKAYSVGQLNGILTILVMVVTVILWDIILLLWEKVNYVGSLEWLLSVLAGFLLIDHRKVAKNKSTPINGRLKKYSWWKPLRLDVTHNFYNIHWVDITPESDINHNNAADSKMAIGLACLGFLVFPLSILALIVALKAQSAENQSKHNIIARILSIVGILFFVVWFTILTFTTGLVL